MSKATPNPVSGTYPSNTNPAPLSSTTYHIAGILTTVFGLTELPPSCTSVAVLWLLHPRLQTQACMAPFAASCIHAWNARLQQHCPNDPKGLIAVSFDQRNHGTREVDALANEAWRSGNPRHAQDMFSCFHGTALDTSQLITYLPAYAFPEDERQVRDNMVFGISLGGHAAWHVVLGDPRVTSAVVCIGCPDYTRLMSDRARLSNLKTWMEGRGTRFLGSKDFPPALVEAIRKYDPAGLFWDGRGEAEGGDKEKVRELMKRTLGRKRILNLSGGADKLVPYKCGEPFVRWLKDAIGSDGGFEDGGLIFEDMVFDGVGHEVPPSMKEELVRFVCDSLGGNPETSTVKKSSRDSRM